MLLTRRLFPVFLLIVFAFAIVGCGGASSGSTETSGSIERQKAEFEAEVGSTIDVPDAPPPKRLVVKDLKVGTGAAAKSGDELEFQYVGAAYATGKVFSVAAPGVPYHLTLDGEEGLKGFQKGLMGMKVGGRRELIVPPGLAFGEEGVPPDVPAGATVVFLIGLVGIK